MAWKRATLARLPHASEHHRRSGRDATKNRWHAPFWCGTCALVRVSALRSVGGAMAQVGRVFRSPVKVAALIGGTAIVSLTYVVRVEVR